MTDPVSDPVAPAPSSVTARRRSLLLGGVAAAAGAAGAGFAWWKFQPHAVEPGAEALLWSQRFDAPQGEPVALERFRGRPLVLNFWATWCPPCVEELPLLNRFYQTHSAQGWQVVGLAIDQPSAVRTFLQRMPLDFPVGLAGLGGSELGRSLGNLTGGLPFTVLLGSDGNVRQRKMGQVTQQDLQQWVSSV